MTSDVDWITPDTPIRKAAQRMRNDDVGALPIGENDRLIGMLTDRDIVIRLLPDDKADIGRATVRDAMSDQILYCFEDETLEDVALNMAENKVRRLPVLNGEKRLVGMVSLGDIAKRGMGAPAGAALGEITQAP